MLRLLLLIVFTVPKLISAQSIQGRLLDQVSELPIPSATVQAGRFTAFTDSAGRFSIFGVGAGDTIRANHMSYLPYARVILPAELTRELVIKLAPRSIVLSPVQIHAPRDYVKDSLKRREEYAEVFAHKNPGLSDMLVPKSTVPDPNYKPFQQATSSIVSLDVLSVIGFFKRNKNPVSKLKKKLLQDEMEGFAGRIFSEEKVRAVTALSGDSLRSFMEQYRPPADSLMRMSDYDLLFYIKERYKEFRKK